MEVVLECNRKTAIVTGATGGLGKAITMCLAKQGFNLALLGTSSLVLSSLKEEINQFSDGSVSIFEFDARDIEGSCELIGEALGEFSSVDFVYFCHARNLCSPVIKSSYLDISSNNNINFVSIALMSKRCAEFMIDRGGGKIVFILSGVAYFPLPYFAAYSASKSALQAFAKAMRTELEDSKLNIFTVYPGKMQTEFDSKTIGADGISPTRRFKGHMPEKIASAIVKTSLQSHRELHFGFLYRVLAILNCLTPHFAEWIIRKLMRLGKNDG